MNNIEAIINSAQSCDKCYPGKEISVPLLDPNNAKGQSDVVFVNERPGRQGAGQTGYVSFDNEDPTAIFFRECFELTGLSRKNVCITNACLCFPVFAGYTDKKPTIRELKNCQYWLKQVIELANPNLIVTVGRSAWESVIRLIDYRPSSNFLNNVGKLITKTNTAIFPVAHTSRRGRVNRSAELQKKDWAEIPNIIQKLKTP